MYFLAIIDTTIASTSLVAIADDLGNYEMVSWVLTSYLLGYVGKLQRTLALRIDADNLSTYATTWANLGSRHCDSLQVERHIWPQVGYGRLHHHFDSLFGRMRCCADAGPIVSNIKGRQFRSTSCL